MAIEERLAGTSQSDRSVWIILVGLLFVSVLVAGGLMAIINANQHGQQPTAAQSAPVPPAPAAVPAPAAAPAAH
jgi:flagellar basal body-associated protein FliL